MKKIAIALLALTSTISVAAQSAGQIQPESYVIFPKAAVACLSKDGLQKITEHYIKGESTKGNAMLFSKQNPNAECVGLSQNSPYKVLSAEYNNPDAPEMGLIEVVGKGSKSAEGAWTFSMFAEPAKKK